MRITTLTTATFDEEVRTASQLMLVDFWADGCELCKAMLPSLEEIAVEYAGTLRIGELKLDDAPDLARRFEIMALPTLIIFTDGEPKKRMIGAMGKDRLLNELAEFLS